MVSPFPPGFPRLSSQWAAWASPEVSTTGSLAPTLNYRRRDGWFEHSIMIGDVTGTYVQVSVTVAESMRRCPH